jgi:hypothetical protein
VVDRAPPLPDLGDQLAGDGVVREPHRAVRVRRVAGRHAPVVQQRVVTVLGERRAAVEVLPEVVERPVVVVAESADRLAELGQVAHLE